MPDLPRLLAEDPPYAVVSERRQSTRRQGSDPLTFGQLSEFLFRTLHQRRGRRPYPSGGSCYPLHAYVAVHRCLGIVPGLYAYDPAHHELSWAGEPGPGLDELLADAAEAASIAQTPQILLVLAARYERTHRVYGDLSYSLILKEVGAVFQAAMMAAAAMGVGACPLGCGNSLLFADLVGVNPLTEVSVGEMMIGSLDPTA
jgi:SagB-type dehydrogenase family enzyme